MGVGKVLLCLTGSAAIMRAPELAREFSRWGAEVRVVMSPSASQLLSPTLMHWATGREVVTSLTGEIEHIKLSEWADAVVVAPATASTLGKLAWGIADTPVTATVIAASGLGKPIFLAPAMHASMYLSGPVQDSVARLRERGFVLLGPVLAEGRAKMMEPHEIVLRVMFHRPPDLRGVRVAVTAGPTVEPIDGVKMISNFSSGKMGIAVARMAALRGAEVVLIYGPGTERPPEGVRTIRVRTTQEMKEALEEEVRKGVEVVVAAAAAQDLMVEKPFQRKLRSTETVELRLVPAPRVADGIKRLSPGTFLVGFKAERGVSEEELVSRAEEKLRAGFDLVVANDLSLPGAGFGEDTNDVVLVHRSGRERMRGRKEEIAHRILDLALQGLGKG
ncbi:MAG: bifunctional phosphopantothenoylcysteine decarboxylase/phosphopantothenate--cysteine ligase CoaBC [Hadesarchaea archaeon]|nr:MAG: bifunctional phosphopantothenoylcysteine decarboxylase/phosphopantothenate--cysteine ligase CoaBC [Hadesarchaea archaeon]